jgi:hypothetical protein
LLSFAAWIGGFISKEIVWRNERYRLLKGRLIKPIVTRRSSLQGRLL